MILQMLWQGKEKPENWRDSFALSHPYEIFSKELLARLSWWPLSCWDNDLVRGISTWSAHSGHQNLLHSGVELVWISMLIWKGFLMWVFKKKNKMTRAENNGFHQGTRKPLQEKHIYICWIFEKKIYIYILNFPRIRSHYPRNHCVFGSLFHPPFDRASVC